MVNIFSTKDIKQIANLLSSGKIGILPTDTIYGLHCRANDETIIKRIYELKERPEEKKVITIISNIEQLDTFKLTITDEHKRLMAEKWPGRNTIVFDASNDTTMASRLPDNEF